MFKKNTVIIISIVILISIVSSLGIHASASDSNTDEKIYYSDLFYGYDTSYLTNNAYIEDYYDDVDDVARDVFNDYINSPRYFWTQIETSVAAALNAREFFELMSDTYGGTNFNYTDAMDSANLIFAKALIGKDSSTATDAFGAGSKLLGKIKMFMDAYSNFQKNFTVETSETVIIEEFFAMISEEGIILEIDSYTLTTVKEYILPEIGNIKKAIKGAKSVFDALEAVSVGLMLEDTRLEILDEIIENSDSHETVHNGMLRLQSQLKSTFKSYFVLNYLKDEILNEMFSAFTKSTIGMNGAYEFVTSCLKIASWISFDVIFQIPDMDEMLVQMILHEYVKGFKVLLERKAGTFRLQFDADDIIEYEALFEGLVASCKASITATKKLTLSSNEAKLAEVQSKYKWVNYDDYIASVKADIAAIPANERKIKKFHEWTINEATCFTSASDTIEDGHIYEFRDGFNGSLVIEAEFNIDCSTNIYGDVTVNDPLTISKGATLTVDGDVTINAPFTISKGATLTVDGDVTVRYDGELFNHGTLNVVNMDLYRYYHQTEEDAVLNITGSFLASSFNCDITAGTVVFKGKEQQTVKGLSAYNIEVLNPNGIKYLSSLKLYGTYDLHGNPLVNDVYYTYPYEDATFVEGSNYKYIYIDSDYTLNCNILCDTIIVSSVANVTIKEDTAITINGNLMIFTPLTIPKGATLTVDGDVTVRYDGDLFNHGTFNVVNMSLYHNAGYDVGYYHQTEKDAVLNITGYFSGSSFDCCDITAGTVVFNGKEQQTVKYLKAYNIEVLNPNGIKYLTLLKLYGTYDLHGNPLDNNGYYTLPYEDATFVEGSNYKDIYINSDYTWNSNVLCDTITICANVTISKGAVLTVDGDVTVNGNGDLFNHGTLNVVNMSLYYHYYNVGYDVGYYHQTEKDAVLNITGYFSGASFDCCDITAGTVVFNGKEQQTVDYLKAYNVDVLNPEGIKYLSDVSVFGTYDLHGNPLDTNGFNTHFYNDGTFGILECYHSEWITEREASCEQSGFKYIECTVCGEIVIKEEIHAFGHLYDNDSDTTCNICGKDCENIMSTEESSTENTEISIEEPTSEITEETTEEISETFATTEISAETDETTNTIENLTQEPSETQSEEIAEDITKDTVLKSNNGCRSVLFSDLIIIVLILYIPTIIFKKKTTSSASN